MAPRCFFRVGYGNKSIFPRYHQTPKRTNRENLFQVYWKNDKAFSVFFGMVYHHPYRVVILPPISTFGFVL